MNWVSPIGRALLGSSAGDLVSFATSGGRTELEIIKVEYQVFE